MSNPSICDYSIEQDKENKTIEEEATSRVLLEDKRTRDEVLLLAFRNLKSMGT